VINDYTFGINAHFMFIFDAWSNFSLGLHIFGLLLLFRSLFLQESILMNEGQHRLKRFLFTVDYSALLYALIHLLNLSNIYSLLIVFVASFLCNHCFVGFFLKWDCLLSWL